MKGNLPTNNSSSIVISCTSHGCRPPHFSHKRPHDPAIPLVFPSAHPPKTVAVSLPSSSAPGHADPVLFLPQPAESSSSSDPPPPLSSPSKSTHAFSRWPLIAPQHATSSFSTPEHLSQFGTALLPPSWLIPPPRAAPAITVDCTSASNLLARASRLYHFVQTFSCSLALRGC